MIETESRRRAFEEATGRVLKAADAPRGKPLIEVLVPGYGRDDVPGQGKPADVLVQQAAVLGVSVSGQKIDRPFSGQEDLCERCAEILKAREASRKRAYRERKK
jgi:hypothetical protein